MNAPQFLIMECPQSLPPFVALLKRPELPTIDIDAVLSQIVDAVTVLDQADDNLSSTALYMRAGEGLSERWILEDGPSDAHLEEMVIHGVVCVGQEIKNNLLDHNAYRHGHCPYTYRNLVNASTILFSWTGSAST